MTSTPCRVCSAPTDAYLCHGCTDKLDATFVDLPALVDALVTSTVRQSRVYRANGRRREPDQDWRGSAHALPPHAMPVDLDAAWLLHAAANGLTTWARHLAEARGVPLALNVGQPTEGPVCAPHVHDMRPGGCGHDAECRELHCMHRSCETIRHGEYTGTAATLVRWFLRHRDAIRYDEAAGELHAGITALRDELARTVDRMPSPLWAGPCHANVTEPVTAERDGTVYIEIVEHRCERQLFYFPGAESIICDGGPDPVDDGCRTVHTFSEREYRLVAEVEDALVGIDEIARVLPTLFKAYPQPPKSVMHAWVRQGRLVAHGLNHAGQPTFRGGDLLALVKAYRPHAYAPRTRRTA